MMIGFVQPGTRRGMFEITIGSRKMTPPRMLRIVPLGERYMRLSPNSSTRASSGVIVAHLTPTPYSLIALAASTVIWSSVSSRLSIPRSKYFRSTSRYGRISWSLMNCQMIRVISSPSSSTTVPSTLILLMIPLSSYGSCAAERSTHGIPTLGRPCPPVRGRERRRSEVGDVGLLGADGLRGLLQPRQLALGQVALDDTPHALPADLGLDAEVHALDAVLPVDPRADGHDGAGVLHHGLRHAGRGGRRRVVRRPGLQQSHHLGAAVTRAVDQVVDAVLPEDVGQRLAVDGAARGHRHHRVAVRAESEG